jgi:hypothetical protein
MHKISIQIRAYTYSTYIYIIPYKTHNNLAINTE